MDDPDHRNRTPDRRALDLSLVQVAASALATVVAAILASELGVYGTIAGAAVVSIVATTGGAVFQHLFRRTGEGIRSRVPAAPGAVPEPAGAPGALGMSGAAAQPGESVGTYRAGRRLAPRGWKTYALLTGLVFVLAMGTVTAVELVAGKPLAAVVRNEPGSGTSWGGSAGKADPRPARTPDPARSGGAGSGQGGSSVPDPSSTPGAGAGADPATTVPPSAPSSATTAPEPTATPTPPVSSAPTTPSATPTPRGATP
ncbi:hypothetical protein [Streptacidiphilus cavernicola]|uniref:Uncharacterized protein n=1 Tax=Streptacidiphilus cavernicola TaxID=3342716 RepID=A0ABV6W1D1_9ACTN